MNSRTLLMPEAHVSYIIFMVQVFKSQISTVWRKNLTIMYNVVSTGKCTPKFQELKSKPSKQTSFPFLKTVLILIEYKALS